MSKVQAKKENALKMLKYYNIPDRDRENAEKLYLKGIKKYKKNKYEEALNLYYESFNLNPQAPNVRDSIIVILQVLKRDDEIQDFLKRNKKN